LTSLQKSSAGGNKKTMLTSLSHAKTLLVSSSALPVSLYPNNIPLGQLREPRSRRQPGPAVGLLLYVVGSVMKYEFTVTGSGRKNEKVIQW